MRHRLVEYREYGDCEEPSLKDDQCDVLLAVLQDPGQGSVLELGEIGGCAPFAGVDEGLHALQAE